MAEDIITDYRLQIMADDGVYLRHNLTSVDDLIKTYEIEKCLTFRILKKDKDFGNDVGMYTVVRDVCSLVFNHSTPRPNNYCMPSPAVLEANFYIWIFSCRPLRAW